ncbi:putative D-lactate dehydrogenase (cytochrome) [Helianthus anomalus]
MFSLQVAMCNFPTIKDAANVAIVAMLSGNQVSRVELLDEVQVKAINLANGKELPEFPTLMFELIGTSNLFLFELGVQTSRAEPELDQARARLTYVGSGSSSARFELCFLKLELGSFVFSQARARSVLYLLVNILKKNNINNRLFKLMIYIPQKQVRSSLLAFYDIA